MTAIQGIFEKNFPEPEKVAIRRSRITALLRTLIHAMPLAVAIFEITVNLKGHFVGVKFDKQNWLQFAAKAHEIAIQASITTVLLSYIRYQISAGNGIPFGAVLGGLEFLQVSYLWSMELWSSLLSQDFRLKRKVSFAFLILICVTVATTAGPSSASLLIARQGLWPTASTYLAVNGSVQEIWPDQLDDGKIGRDCATVRFDSLMNAYSCPISNIYTDLITDTNGSIFDSSLNQIPDEIFGIGVQSSGANYWTSLLSTICSTLEQGQFCASIPQTEFLHGFYSSQSHHTSKDSGTGYQTIQNNYYQPYTIASCVADVVHDASDQAPLRFARISETSSQLNKDREIVSIPGLTKGEIIKNMSGKGSAFLVDWIDLPTDIFNSGIPGAIIVNSQSPIGSSYNITTCTLNAGWGSSTLMSVSTHSAQIVSHMSNIPSSWPSSRKVFWDQNGYLFEDQPNFRNISNGLYPQRRISISKSWMEFLNPTVVFTNNRTVKYISHRLSSLQSPPTEENVARLLNYVLAVGLASTGAELDWEGIYEQTLEVPDCIRC